MKMSRFFIFFLIMALMSQLSLSQAMAQDKGSVPPKTKAFLIVSGYGMAGGALLGLASMAFGEEARAIFQGASLGLYAGMLFGGYVILAHKYKNARPMQNYNDPITPYSPEAPMESPYGGGFDGGGFFDSPTPEQAQRVMQAEDDNLQSRKVRSILKEKEGSEFPLYINLMRMNF
jgi:hypothetical protein